MKVANDARGVTLIEILMALTLLAVIMGSLAPLVFQVARQSLVTSQKEHLIGVMSEQVGRLNAVPFDELAGVAGCVTDTEVEFPHERCIVVAAQGSRVTRVTVVVTPILNITTPDSVSFLRTRTLRSNPFP